MDGSTGRCRRWNVLRPVGHPFRSLYLSRALLKLSELEGTFASYTDLQTRHLRFSVLHTVNCMFARWAMENKITNQSCYYKTNM